MVLGPGLEPRTLASVGLHITLAINNTTHLIDSLPLGYMPIVSIEPHFNILSLHILILRTIYEVNTVTDSDGDHMTSNENMKYCQCRTMDD